MAGETRDGSASPARDGERCTYVHEFEDSPVRTGQKDWTCPHPSVAGEDRCVFHLPLDAKNPDAVVEAFVRVVRRPDEELTPEERMQFVGATFPSLSLPMFSELAVNGLTNPNRGANRLDLRDVEVAGDLSVRRSTIRHGLDLRGAEIGGDLVLSGTTIEGDVEATDLTCRGDVDCSGLDGNSQLFLQATVGGSLSVDGSSLSGNLLVQDCEIATGDAPQGELSANGCTIDQQAKLKGTEVDGDCAFRETSVRSDLALLDLSVEGDLHIGDAVVAEDLWLGDGVVDGSLRAEGLAVEGTCFLFDLAVGGRLRLQGAKLESLQADPVLAHPGISEVELQGSAVGELSLAGLDDPDLVYGLAGARIGDVRVECETYPTALNHLHLRKTDFGAYDFESLKSALVAEGWDLFAHESEQASRRVDHGAFVTAEGRAQDFTRALGCHQPAARDVASGDLDPRVLDEVGTAVASGAFDANVAAVLRDPDGDVLELPDVRDLEQAGDLFAVGRLVHPDDQFLAAADARPVRDAMVAVGRAVADGESVDEAERALCAALHDEMRSNESLDPVDAEATYRNAKMAAEAAGAQEAAAKFFVRELRTRRDRHRKRFRSASDVPERARSAVDWASNWLLDTTTGYGEQPKRVVLASMLVIGLFTLLFAALRPGDPPYGSPIGYAVLSLESFITLVLASSETIDDPVVRFVAEIEGFLGAFSVALFVFTLTRSIHR